MFLEKAYVKYDKNGNYDYTNNSDYMFFKSFNEAKKYAFLHLEKDVEFYFFETERDIEKNNFFKVIICNNFKTRR